MPRRLHVSWALPLVLVACRPDTVDLAYRFPVGSREYRMEAAATARWDIGASGTGSYRVVFDVSEEIRADEGDTAVVEVTMSPVDVEEDGLASPGARTLSFSLRIDRAGEVQDVLEVDGVDAEELSEEETALIGTYRPRLPDEPVGLGDAWTSQPLEDAVAELATTGKLESLYEDEGGPVAELSYSGAGPLERTMDLPQGTAKLSGSATTSGVASFDIDDGVLRSASSSLEGRFTIRVVPLTSGGTPLTGTLRLDLDVSVVAAGA